MDKYYHFTSWFNLGSIANQGLLPSRGFRSYSIKDKRCGVFLSKGIVNSIQMYAQMLHYYNKIIGNEGTKTIKDCYRDLYFLSFKPLDENVQNDINECYETIYRIYNIRQYSFMDFLGGPSCLLSVNGIIPNDESVPNDCFCEGIISPFNINLVKIMNKKTYYQTYNTNEILSMYMNKYPIEEILKNVPIKNHEDIEDLYQYINNYLGLNYNPNEYDVIEEPIIYHNYNHSLTRTIM